jgi:CRISPR/Cas system CSM-associated protein Csm4 (group 5 of RAMP superfamily)
LICLIVVKTVINQEQAMAMAQQSFDAFRQMILESAKVYSELPTDGELETSESLVVPEPPSQPIASNRKMEKRKKKKKKKKI